MGEKFTIHFEIKKKSIYILRCSGESSKSNVIDGSRIKLEQKCI